MVDTVLASTYPPVSVGHQVFLRDARLDEVVIEFQLKSELVVEGLDQQRRLMVVLRGLEVIAER